MSKSKKTSKSRVRNVIAQALISQGVEYVFGIVGYPVIELGMALQQAGLKYIGMRNEQAASYAAGAIGYLTGRPGCCLVVPGPGVIHALAGMANSSANGWPMICLAGSSELSQDGLGAFQESLPPQGGAQMQLQYTTTMCKYAVKATDPNRIPFLIEQAVRYSINGRPGAVYVEVAGDTLRESVNAGLYYPPKCIDPPITLAPVCEVNKALELLKSAQTPLLITGKGAAYAGAAPNLREFVKRTGIPFLPSPMGKGVISDDHPLCVSSARSFSLKNADVILLVGARLNWILHYGMPPRYKNDVKFIHIEKLPEEIGQSRLPAVALCGDAKAITGQLLENLDKVHFKVDINSQWIKSLKDKSTKSKAIFSKLSNDRSAPMNYYCALGIVNKYIPHDAIIMNEGSDTMDIGRTVLMNYEPKKRLDAASWGTMGVGMGQSIAAALCNPDPGCVAVFGDSAFGFSGMELEVITRYQLPVVCVIINNNGIGPYNPQTWKTFRGKSLSSNTSDRLKYPVKSLSPLAHYEGFATALGAKGVYVDTADDLEKACKDALSQRPFKPTVINCIISKFTSRGKKAAPVWASGKL